MHDSRPVTLTLFIPNQTLPNAQVINTQHPQSKRTWEMGTS
jgi:hypothetical protein